MTLVRSGQLGLGDINVELGRSRTAQISLDTAENGGYGAINQNSKSRPSSTNPAAVSEWYNYNHTFVPAPVTSDIPWEYINDASTTIPFRIYVNGTAIANTTLSAVGESPAAFGATVSIEVYDNSRIAGSTTTLLVERDGTQIFYQGSQDTNIFHSFVVQNGVTEYFISAKSSRFALQQ
tara:strand:+ start:1579 stop:2115 length:537 start_codon:yes stop_codon:yes gene_type:complete